MRINQDVTVTYTAQEYRELLLIQEFMDNINRFINFHEEELTQYPIVIDKIHIHSLLEDISNYKRNNE